MWMTFFLKSNQVFIGWDLRWRSQTRIPMPNHPCFSSRVAELGTSPHSPLWWGNHWTGCHFEFIRKIQVIHRNSITSRDSERNENKESNIFEHKKTSSIISFIQATWGCIKVNELATPNRTCFFTKMKHVPWKFLLVEGPNHVFIDIIHQWKKRWSQFSFVLKTLKAIPERYWVCLLPLSYWGTSKNQGLNVRRSRRTQWLEMHDFFLNPLKKGTILKGNESSSKHQFSGFYHFIPEDVGD